MSRFLLTADWHVRDNQPSCRTDDFQEAMWRKVDWVVDTAVALSVDAVLHAGDLFDRARPIQSQALEIGLIGRLEKLQELTGGADFWIVPGNHDLVYRTMSEIDRSSLGVLIRSGFVRNLHDSMAKFDNVVVIGAGWEMKLDCGPNDDVMVGVIHEMICHGEAPMVKTWSEAEAVLRSLKGFDVILTGHNHKQFCVEKDGRWLVNPGTLLRSSVSEMDHEPAVYLFDSEKGEMERIPVPIEFGVVSREMKDRVEERNERLDAFVESMKTDYDVGLSFEKNLEVFLETHKVSARAQALVWEAAGH